MGLAVLVISEPSLGLDDFRRIVALCDWSGPFAGWQVHVRWDQAGSRCYLQVSDPQGVCNISGRSYPWTGRKWFLSPYMTRSEVVQTVWKALQTALEHEAREAFFYKGATIFDPHLDVDALVEFRRRIPLSHRPNGMEGG